MALPSGAGLCRAWPRRLRSIFQEYWANPSYGLAGTPGVFFRHREGPVEIFALDCRMYRPDVGDGGSRGELASAPPSLPMSGGPLGQTQLDWRISGVAESDAPFKLLACGSRFTAEGSLDSWAAFDTARNALHQRMHDAGIEGVVFLSGDIHRTNFRMNFRNRRSRARGNGTPASARGGSRSNAPTARRSSRGSRGRSRAGRRRRSPRPGPDRPVPR